MRINHRQIEAFRAVFQTGSLPPTGSAVATAQTRRMSRRCWRERGLS
jgi:hypothetical protein